MNQSRPCRSAPYRSALYLPASNARALDKARDLPADAIIFDLEDAVAPAEKAAARGALRDALARDYGNRARIVRINGFDSEWGRDDAAAFATGADAVLVPKVNGPADLDAVAAVVPGTPLWAMLETAAGVLNAAAIAGHSRLGGLVMGTNDLARELGCRDRADRMPLLPALGMCLLAARARGRVILDGVYNAFRDTDGLRAECAQGRDMGFDGKTLIHPAQIDIANAVFAPTDDEIALSRRRIEAFDAALAEGRRIAIMDGRIVENLHVETARATLDRAAAIGALSG